MSKKCLVTTSLVSSVQWAQTAPNSIIKPGKGGDGKLTWASKAVSDLKATLGREPYEMNDAAKRGIWFENKVYATAKSGVVSSGSDNFRKVVEECIGGQQQRKAKMDYVVNGEECFLYGKEDIFFPEGIKDIKTTGKFKEEKYIESFQHTFYCFIEKIWRFKYIIAEWSTYPTINKVYMIPLEVDPIYAKKIVDTTIEQTFNYLKSHGLWELYRESYCLY